MLEDLRYNRNQRGVTAVLVALLMVVFLGLAALAVDISHLYVVRNELQNAADAGALAGARVLYNEEGTAVNPLANQVGHDAAEANRSENTPVEANWTGGNNGDVQRGHWSFGLGSLPRGFYPNDSLLPVDLWNSTTQELDENLDFINAVKVTTRRETTPAASFFARIFGYLGFRVNAEAVAYIGFSGTIIPWTLDQPIAICVQAILKDGLYDCSTGRMINSGSSGATHNSAAWTNLSQPCSTANVPSVRPLVCGDGNPTPVNLGAGIGTVNGMQDTVFNQFRNCWTKGSYDTDGDNIPDSPIDTDHDGVPDQPWKITLPVVCCGEFDPVTKKCTPEDYPTVSNCMPVLGSVEVQILWITESGTGQVTFPRKMESWSCPSGTETECWNSFTSPNNFNLKNFDGSLAQLEKKSIYIKPDCTPHVPAGNTGGQNFGILAEIPALVK